MSDRTNSSADSRRPLAATLAAALSAAVASAMLGGCQLLPQTPAPEPVPPVVVGPPAPEATAGAVPARLVDAMDHLQNGEFDEAEAMIDRLRLASPGSPTLALLAEQLDSPPEQLLPGPYRTLTVQPGDTLSEIAERELGNPLLFIALARLNGIEVPRTVGVGAELRIPTERPPSSDALLPSAPSSADAGRREPAVAEAARVGDDRAGEVSSAGTEAAPARRSELETVAEYLLASGQPTDARELLLAAARQRNLSPRAERLLVELTLDSAQAEAEAEQVDEAVATLAQVAAALDPGPSRARLDARRTRIEVQGLMERARAFEQRGLLFDAYALAEDALLLEPNYGPAADLENELREGLVENYHERALRAWRARDIDLAIRTWRELLDVVPDFEPARVYLERAERLRSRLGDPGS